MRKPQIVSLDEYAETNQVAATTPHTEDEALTKLQRLELRRIVAALPDLQRRVIQEYYGLGFAPREDATQASVGVAMGLSTSQVGRLLTSARASLFTKLELAA